MRLSVVVPCHNHGRFLNDCVFSLYGGYSAYCEKLGLGDGQTLRGFELIMVDDASEDDTWIKMSTIAHVGRAAGNAVVAVKLGRNVGTPAALNIGIEKATGVYVAIVHADDLVEPWHLRSLLDHAAKDRFCYGDIRVVRDGERANTLLFSDWNTEKAKRTNTAHAAILFPKVAFDLIRYPEMMKAGREDWAFTLALACAGFDGFHVEGPPSYLYRKEGQGKSEHNHTAEWYERFRAQVKLAVPEAYDD